MARKANDPKASNWDRLSGREDKDTLQFRDVFEDQQLDRSKIDGVRKRTARLVLTWVVAAVVALIAWSVLAGVAMAGSAFMGMVGGSGTGGQGGGGGSFYVMTDKPGSTMLKQFCVLDGPEGSPTTECYPDEVAVQDAKPQWYIDAQSAPPAQDGAEEAAPAEEGSRNYVQELFHFEWWKLIVSLLAGLGVAGVIYPILIRNLDAQNLMNDTSDINQYTGDQHIALPDEVMRKFDWFPDVGAHSNVQPSSMISHVMLTNKGLKKVQVSRRADKDVLDEDGDVEYLKGEILRDDDGEALMRTVPLIDESFGDALFDASLMPKDKRMRRKYDTSAIEYNPDGSNRDKLGKFKTVADLINEDWIVPEYEVQLPGGAYIVDTAPVNTMVLAITRAGKGQTYIEPMIDMWLRERRPNNMVINDPKGELLVKHYVRATMRGYQVVQFNLINAMKTDIYNPLGMAAESAREGDVTKTAMYVENIADVFFPLDGGEDPVWPAAANNAFKRAAYGLIDFYLEEERALRATAARTDMDPKVLDQRLDAIWGKVTLYNCYQLFVQLSSKKQKNPVKEVEAQAKAGAFGNPQDPEEFDDDAYLEAKEEAQARSFLWEDKDELDLLTLYFNATQGMPRNSMRTLVANADNALRAMGAAEKMLASVYGIAITAMSFFTDPTISTLTSGTPSQNTDLGGLSFPRRMGVRFGMNYLKRDHLIGAQAKWDAFGDPGFTEPLGEDFDHEDIVSREGWAKYYFMGKFEKDVAYLRLRLVNPQTGMLIRSFYFRFTKDYQTSLNGRFFIKDPITGAKIVKNGILVELTQQDDGSYAPGHTEYPHTRLTNIDMALPEKEVGRARAIISDTVRYSEQPKAVFLVTPPHLMKYAKLILILVKQLVDLNFDKSYMTKSNQKPLYKTRFMLDELGNLQSEGHGISGFETMLSIGLGQEQQFTLILQTLQQLRDVYGESVDKIVQGNAQAYSAKIATPSGWTTMGETEVGTEVLIPDGGSAFVSGVYPRGERPVYKVTRADGSSAEACNEHLWEVELDAVETKKGSDMNATTLSRSAVITTDELKALVDAGYTVRLPQVRRPDDEVLALFPEEDVARLAVPAAENPIIGVDYVRDEPVQCISITDERHLYITDDFIPTHNTSNIVYLKSTDDSMIETLSKMSGTRHVTYRDSKSVTKDTERLIKGLNVEGKVTYTMNTKEEAVISYNDMAFISEKNSIVFRAGDAPVWNRNETILPMSFRLFKDTIVHPGHDYTLQTIPTLSSALDFDVRMNQPDFEEMLKKRMREAEATVHARALYQQVFEYSDVDIARLDPDVYADEVMELVDQATREMIAQEEGIDPDEADASLDGAPDGFYDDGGRFEEDMEMQHEAAQRATQQAELDRKIYAGGTISRSNLVRNDGSALQGPLDREIVQAYLGARVAMERDTAHFTAVSGGTLRSVDGTKVYIEPVDESESVAALRSGSTSDTDGVYADDPDSIESLAALTGYRVDGSFYEFLASMDSWRPIAGGEFEGIMAKLMSDDMASAV